MSQEALAAKLDFMRPLHAVEPEREEGMWRIPFEWGSNEKGTKISIAKAREISSELRAQVAEAEYRELRRYFDKEVERGAELERQLSELQRKLFESSTAIILLEEKLRRRGRKK